MNTRLFDASSLMLLAKRNPEKASTTLEGQGILDLTIYELGKALWKVAKLIDKSDKSTALEALELIHNLTALMELMRPEGLEDLTGTMEIAFDTGLSFYDSAYIQTARRNGLVLVTEDERLMKRAKELGLNCIKAIDCDLPT
jgi:predicted nucleic acid-binding protein